MDNETPKARPKRADVVRALEAAEMIAPFLAKIGKFQLRLARCSQERHSSYATGQSQRENQSNLRALAADVEDLAARFDEATLGMGEISSVRDVGASLERLLQQVHRAL